MHMSADVRELAVVLHRQSTTLERPLLLALRWTKEKGIQPEALALAGAERDQINLLFPHAWCLSLDVMQIGRHVRLLRLVVVVDEVALDDDFVTLADVDA